MLQNKNILKKNGLHHQYFLLGIPRNIPAVSADRFNPPHFTAGDEIVVTHDRDLMIWLEVRCTLLINFVLAVKFACGFEPFT